MKYRTKQVGKDFFPQYKFLWFWCNFQECGFDEFGQPSSDYRFKSLEQSEDFIRDAIEAATVKVFPYEG